MKIWVYIDGAQRGPFTEDEVKALNITPDTKIWFAGLPKWYPASLVPEMKNLIASESVEVAVPEVPEVPVSAEEGQTGYALVEEEVEVNDGVCVEQPCPQIPEMPIEPQMPAPQPAPKCPESYVVWSVVLLVLCCTPFAVASLITGILTMTRYNAGLYQSAQKLSEATAWLLMIGFALGCLPNIFLLALL